MLVPYSSQPQGPAPVNPAHPFASLLESAWYPGINSGRAVSHGRAGREGIFSQQFTGSAADRMMVGTVFSLIFRRNGTYTIDVPFIENVYDGGGGNVEKVAFASGSGSTKQILTHNGTTWSSYGTAPTIAIMSDLSMMWDATTASPSGFIVLDGVYQGAMAVDAVSPFPWDAGNPRTINVGNEAVSTRAACVLIFRKRLSTAQVGALRRNPWGIFGRQRIFFPPSGAFFQGVAQAESIAAGSLTTQIRLAGISSSTSTASGSLTTQITLAGSAASVAVSNGVLTTQIRLSSAAVAQAAAAGQITTQVRLSGAAVSAALASAVLTGAPAALSGSASASASSAATLTTGIPLLGAASSLAIASGGLTTAIRLAGVSAAVCAATGTLTVSLGLSAAAVAQAAAGGTLTTQIRLNAAAVASALASATLFGTEAALLSDPRYRAPGVVRSHESHDLARIYASGHASQGGRRYETEVA